MKKAKRKNSALLGWSMAVCLAFCLAACGDDDEPETTGGEQGTTGGEGGGALQPQTATLTLSDGRTITYGYATIGYEGMASEDGSHRYFCTLDFTSIPFADTELETGMKWDDFIIEMELTEPGKLPTGSIPYSDNSNLVKPNWNECEIADYDYTPGGNEDGTYFYTHRYDEDNVSMNITEKDGGYRIEMRDMKLVDNGVSGSTSKPCTGTFVFEGAITVLN